MRRNALKLDEGKAKGLPFGIDMVWQKPKDYLNDCYFCMVNTKGIEKKNREITYCPSILSAIKLDLHSDDFSPPVFNGFVSYEDEIEFKDERMEYEYKRTDTESEYSSSESQKRTPQQFNQSDLNDLVRDLDLSKETCEILASIVVILKRIS